MKQEREEHGREHGAQQRRAGKDNDRKKKQKKKKEKNVRERHSIITPLSFGATFRERSAPSGCVTSIHARGSPARAFGRRRCAALGSRRSERANLARGSVPRYISVRFSLYSPVFVLTDAQVFRARFAICFARGETERQRQKVRSFSFAICLYFAVSN